MKKFLFFTLFLFILGCGCKFNEKEVTQIATPIVNKIVQYSKTNGFPKSLLDIKLPVELKPCNNKNIKLCTKNGYYFYKNNAYGVIIILYDVYDKQKDLEELLNYYPTDKSKEVRGISLIIAYNNSQCLYEIYKNKKLNKNYLKPISCSSTCKAYGRQ